MAHNRIPDPVANMIESLQRKIYELEDRIKELEGGRRCDD